MTDNNTIAKNTVILYIRTLFTLLVSLYTSRVVLNVLGVDDYGIYSAVGGVVAMFAIISGALSSSISRYITYELGKNNNERLSTIFCTSINILIIISVIILIIAEGLGVWFLNNKLNIPEGRLTAANWVLQGAIVSFIISLISTPYNACIIAHEHMQAFAYVSILEALLKLGIVFLLPILPYDHLITYAFLLVLVSLIIRIIYGRYCYRRFTECKYKMIFNKNLSREMLGFTGWNFLTNGAMVFNTQGVTLLVNIFFGVAMNAARGIATQVEGAILTFVTSFMTAINPQIIKSYAAGDRDRMFMLICRGARFMFYMLFIFSLPIIIEAETILTIWLKNVPDYAVLFVRLTLIATMANVIGNTGYTACQATGNIKWYSIIVTSVGFLSFLITWLAFRLGAPVESTYVIFFFVYLLVDIVRLFIMRRLLGFPIRMFFKDVFLRVAIVAILSIIIPVIFVYFVPNSLLRLVLSILISVSSSGLVIWFVGMSENERNYFSEIIKNRISILVKRKG